MPKGKATRYSHKHQLKNYFCRLIEKKTALYTKTTKHITYVEKNCGDSVSSSQLTQWGIRKVLVNKYNRESFSTWFKSSIKPSPQTLTSDLNAPIWERLYGKRQVSGRNGAGTTAELT